MKFVFVVFLTLCIPSLMAQQLPKTRVYIEERVVTKAGASGHCDDSGNCYAQETTRTINTSAEATRLFASSCPVVVVTGNPDSADYTLKISPGNSALYAKNGDVAYVSPAKVKLSNVVKDVCKFLETARGAK